MLNDTINILKEKDISLSVSEEAKKFILLKGTNVKFGARPLRRAIQRYIEDEIAEKILNSEILDGENIKVSLENDELKFNII
ncbi:Chaperone protein ClpB [compost metagenome]